LTPNVGGKYPQDGQNRNPSRAFFCPILPPMLVTSQADTDLPDSSTQNPLGQHDRSSTSILLSHSIIKRPTWYSQGMTCTVGARILTSRKQMMGLFRGEGLYRMLRVQPLAVRSRMLLVGVMHLVTSSCSECRSGPDLKTGNQSRNQSRTDAGEIDPEDHETPLPPTRQNLQEPLQEPGPHSSSSNTQTDDVRDSYVSSRQSRIQ